MSAEGEAGSGTGPLVTPLTLELSIEVGKQALVKVVGDLEFGTASPLRTTLLELANDDAIEIVLDLRGVDFIDSTGISLLVQAKQRLDAEGKRFVLRHPTGRVLRVLEIAGLRELFEID